MHARSKIDSLMDRILRLLSILQDGQDRLAFLAGIISNQEEANSSKASPPHTPTSVHNKLYRLQFGNLQMHDMQGCDSMGFAACLLHDQSTPGTLNLTLRLALPIVEASV